MDVQAQNPIAPGSVQHTASMPSFASSTGLDETKKVNSQSDVQKYNKKDQSELKDQLRQIVSDLNKEMTQIGTDLKFGFNEDNDVFYVSVMDKKTDREIRKFPTDEALNLMSKMREVIGQIFDTKG
jgi:flagellar protein FlaG